MKKNYIVIPLLLIISACGGGGGGSSQPEVVSVPPPSTDTSGTSPQPDTASFSELKAEFEGYYEYSRHWGLDAGV